MSELDPDILVDLTTCASAFEAEVIRDSLEQSGIHAFASTTIGSALPWDIASTVPLRVQVRRRDLDAAKAELTAIRKEASGIDWTMQDLGDPEEGEVAARGPGDRNWKEHHEQRKSVGRMAITLAAAVAYGPIALGALLGGLLLRKPVKQSPPKEPPVRGL